MILIYNIGYAGKSLDVFVSHLKQHNINYLIDVRSLPYSSYYREYDRESLTNFLKHHGVKYVYMGDLLGPRSKNPCHYHDDGQISFARLAESEPFKKGIERLKDATAHNVCLMCAEKKAEVCHRYLLIAYFAEKAGLETQSIGFDGAIENFVETQDRLIKELKIECDLFSTQEALREDAINIQVKKYAYRKQ